MPREAASRGCSLSQYAAIEVWGNASKTTLKELQTIQSKIIKLLFHYDFYTPTHKLYEVTKFMHLNQIYHYNTSILIKKILDKKIHTQITLLTNKEKGKRSLRNTDDIYIPKIRTSYGQKTILYAGAKIYNAIPTAIKQCTSLNTFKNKLKTHITEKIKTV